MHGGPRLAPGAMTRMRLKCALAKTRNVRGPAQLYRTCAHFREAGDNSVDDVDLERLSPEEARTTAYLLQGRVAPPYVPIEFGMAERMVVRSVAQAYDCSEAEIDCLLARNE